MPFALLVGCFSPDATDTSTTTTTTTTDPGSTSSSPLDTSGSESTSVTPADSTGPVDDTSSSDGGSGESTTTSADASTGSTTGTAVCGDGAIDDGEDCDDAGESATCDADCTIAECGDTVINAAALEACDDGNEATNDDCIACATASCGDGFVWAGNEACDDGNLDDVDACSNTCTGGSIRVSGNATTYIVSALNALGATFTDDQVEWPAGGVASIIIIAHDGASVPGGDYQAHLDAGGHVLVVGGSGDPAYAAWASTYIANTGEGSWHQSSDCVSDWTSVGAHPITALLPANYEFTEQAISYHMLHFTAAGQDAGTELIGQTCEAIPDNYVLATRSYASGGTFTYMALDLGFYSDMLSEADFVAPFLEGYLAYVQS
jgi:cysteine-rich repeat protein